MLSERSDSLPLLEAIAFEQSARLAAATGRLKEVLSLGDPRRMEGKIIQMAREGVVDEPFLLLLEANALQAEKSGALGPAQLMRRLKQKSDEEKDKLTQKPEIRLLRKLLRTDDEKARTILLEDAFTPKDKLLVDGTPDNAQRAQAGVEPEEQKPEPDVPPPAFIAACKAVLLNFGNLITDDNRGDLTAQIKGLASEAEVVATQIYGKGMTQREQQDRAWESSSTSIFDLETMELDEMSRGEAAPWVKDSNEEDGGFQMPGFGPDGKMRIGGS